MKYKITENKFLKIYCLLCIVAFACNKKDLLDKKTKSSLVIPSSLDDFQALMDATFTMNQSPPIDAAADNYYITTSGFLPMTNQSKNAYTWASDIYQGQSNIDEWNLPYGQVFVANVVLDGITKVGVSASNQQNWNNIKGSALFFRANGFYNVAQLFAPPYDSANANKDLGIPLRLTSDVNAVSVRSTVQQTYDQIIKDLVEAKDLLNSSIPTSNKNRPSKPAAYALLARVYLSMRNYVKAGLYADSCLQLYNTLIDYSTLPVSTSYYTPFTIFSCPEVIFNSYQSVSNVSPGGMILNLLAAYSNQFSVDTTLYQSYASEDLRKTVYYFKFSNGAISLQDNYTGSYQVFSGLATNEMYLVRAECSARTGNVNSAMKDLNDLLRNRWKKVGGVTTYVDQTAANPTDALSKILVERRKELSFKGLRWSDLRRLNKEGYNITLTRIVNGQTYNLLPNDKKYVYPIPPDVIQLTGMQQNPR